MITIYGASWCVFCHKAKALAEEKKLPYKWVDIEEGVNFSYLQENMRLAGATSTTIPQIWVDSTYIGGYTDLLGHLNESN
jgi:glutaredoxin